MKPPPHRIEVGQQYRTMTGQSTSVYPAQVIVISYRPGDRAVGTVDAMYGVLRNQIPASYFHATAFTAKGKPRVTGYYLIG